MQEDLGPTRVQSSFALLECYNSVPQDPLLVHFKKSNKILVKLYF